jgi:hypothetical protein
LSIKRSFATLAGLLALGWPGLASAQADTITTPCPTNFTCAFSAAETLALTTPKSQGSPGQPDVYVGYIEFDGSGLVTLAGLQNVNGTVGQISTGSTSGVACTAGANGQPATVTFGNKTQIAFVTDAGGTELQFILSQDQNTNTSSKVIISNSIRVGVCRKQ